MFQGLGDKSEWNVYSNSNIWYNQIIAKQDKNSKERREEATAKTSWEIRKHSVWKNLWNLNVKVKLKHFMWKRLQNCLPVKEVIYKRTDKGDQMWQC